MAGCYMRGYRAGGVSKVQLSRRLEMMTFKEYEVCDRCHKTGTTILELTREGTIRRYCEACVIMALDKTVAKES